MSSSLPAHLELRHSVRIQREIVLASAVRPAMDTPTWSSMGRIFFWWLEGWCQVRWALHYGHHIMVSLTTIMLITMLMMTMP